MNWFVEVHFEPVSTDSQTLKAFNQACKKEMKASCIHEGQINIYPPHLHPSDVDKERKKKETEDLQLDLMPH